jgi:site-specific recombinase XerD
MELKGLTVEALDDQTPKTFADHLAACACPWRSQGDKCHAVPGTRRFLAYLRDRGVAPRASVETLPEIVGRFEHWMSRHRGVTPSTLAMYRPVLIELVEKIGAAGGFTTTALRSFISHRVAHCGRSRAKGVTSAVRTFLRYLVAHGSCESSLVDAIPTIGQWRLSSLPRYLSSEDVQRIVDAPDVGTATGRRDRAILLLLARLGLRAGDVIGLHLSDIDWHAGTLLVSGKGRRISRLPLPQDVGDAILAYFENGRPRVPEDYVFLAAQAPRGRLVHSWTVTDTVRRAAKKANITMPRGSCAHALRHSLATTLLRTGVPLSTIRTVLRHRSEETTALYAKVDVEALRRIARPWPLEVSPC